MSDPSNICLSCGICCDGTLIGYVQVGGDELDRLKDVMEIEHVNSEGFFLQPCKEFCNGCTIYEDRPKQCDKFNCDLFISVQESEVTFEAAMDIINVVKLKKSAIEERISVMKIHLNSASFHFKMIELKILLGKTQNQSKANETALLAQVDELNVLIQKDFGVSIC